MLPSNKFVVDAEISITKEDFELFFKLSCKENLSVGDLIISCARQKAREMLEVEEV